MAAEPFLIVDLGPDLGQQTFNESQDLKIFLDSELANWDWLEQFAQERNNPRLVVYQSQIRGLTQLKSLMTQVPHKGTDQLRLQLQKRYSEPTILHSSAPMAKIVEELREKHGDHYAAHALHYFIGPGDQRIQIETAIHTRMAQQGLITDGVEAQRATLESLSTDFRARASEALDSNTSLQAELTSSKTAARKLLSELAQETSGFLEASKSDWTVLKDTYEKQMALQAPVTYWRSRRTGHTWLAAIFAVLTAGAFVGAGFAFWFFIDWLFGKDGFALREGIHHYWALAILFAFAAVVFWLIRIVVRLFLSNLHLRTDAAERVTMVQTYLALLREGSALAAEDRTLVLKMLFQSASTGLIKEDPAPPSAVELITKNLKG